jgi:hypothetical protein
MPRALDSRFAGPAAADARRHQAGCALLALLVIAPGLSGCGSSPPQSHPGVLRLLTGRHGSAPAGVDLAAAAHLARRAAAVYAPAAYDLQPPRLPGQTARVSRALALAAARVPAQRRRLRPRLLDLRLTLLADEVVLATVFIGDEQSPPFSVGLTLTQPRGHWRITSISLPS